MSAVRPWHIIVGASVLGGAIGLISWLTSKFKDFNKGTSYEGAGAVGALGNATNQVLGGVPQKIGEAIGSGLFKVFHGDAENIAETDFTVTFPDGAKHAIPSHTIAADGSFQYKGVTYILADDSHGKHFAFRP